MITFELFCADEHIFTQHSVEKAGNMQTIRCLTCGKERVDIMIRKIGTNMNMKKEIWELFEKEPVHENSDEEDGPR
jgi:transcription elongation factor Elf1